MSSRGGNQQIFAVLPIFVLYLYPKEPLEDLLLFYSPKDQLMALPIQQPEIFLLEAAILLILEQFLQNLQISHHLMLLEVLIVIIFSTIIV